MDTTTAHSPDTCPLCVAARPRSFVLTERAATAAVATRRRSRPFPAATPETRAAWPVGREGAGKPLRADRRRLWAATLEALIACDPLGLPRAERVGAYATVANTVAAAVAAGAWPTAGAMISWCEAAGPVRPARAASAAARLRLELS